MDMRTTKLGTTFSDPSVRAQCAAIWGAVAWPGKEQAGFAIVAAMYREEHLGNYDIYLLDEFESYDVRDLVRQCRVLDMKYEIHLYDYRYRHNEALYRWVGDGQHDAASRFIQEINKSQDQSRRFRLRSTPILEMEHPYHYMLPQIRELLNPKRQQLFIKDSMVWAYLNEIGDKEDQIAHLEIGSYPAIEALGFLVVEMRKCMSVADQRARISNPADLGVGNLLEV